MYQLNFSNQTNLLPESNQKDVRSVHFIRSNANDTTACVRSGSDLIGYKYVEQTETWQQHWIETVFGRRGDYPLERYPWLLAKKLLPNTDVVVLKHPEGIRFYQIDPTKPGLQLLKEDGHFHDVYDYTLLLGNFYPTEGYVGVMTRDSSGEVKFYAASSNIFLPTTNYPLFPLQNELSLTPAWHSTDTEFFVAKILHNDQGTIGLRTTKGLEVYQFNTDYLLERIVHTSLIPKSQENTGDYIFFADLTHQKYKDILHLNTSGLFLYQYFNQRDYKLLHHTTKFTKSYGWLQHYGQSIRLTDLDGDNRDDLLFTGPQGITGLSFDSTANNWKTVLSSEQLSASQRYATVIGSTPAGPSAILQPTIFTQDTSGKVQWAKVVLSSTKNPTTSASTPRLPSQTEPNRIVSIPGQVARTDLPEKPTLRWAEQWDDSFLKETVETASGQVNLNIPLVDISSVTGWGLQLTLSYDSRATTSDLLGIGWSLPLAQDYVFVDYQGSITPEDARYYLVVQGVPHLLKLTSNQKGVRCFQLDEEDKSESISIEYHQAAQSWIIEATAEQTTYGKARHDEAQDALAWGLGWPNWRGPGRDKASLQPLITAWYLNKRFDKNNQKGLYYYYEIESNNIEGGKSYSSGLRLKTVSDKQQTLLTFKYSPKAKNEYTVPNPVNDLGYIVFPLPFAQTHYLQGYIVTTSVYNQELEFNYQVDNGKRLLTAISQRLLSHNESVMKFSYQRLLDRHVLTGCQLVPRGSRVNFNYESLTPPIPTIGYSNVLSYPIRENVKIAKGPDYAIMAYRSLNPIDDKVILRIMNRAMTGTITDSLLDTGLPNASDATEIKDYTVQAFPNSFLVFTANDYKKALYIFNRRNNQTWPREPTVYSFGGNALVRFSETVIAAAEPDGKYITLLERAEHLSHWNDTKVSIPRPMTLLAIHKRVVVGYDNNQLWLFHHNAESNWHSHVLDSNTVGVSSMNRNTLASFDLTSAILQQISSTLEQNGLQIINNFILLSGLQIDNGQLFSHIHLFLLDTENKVSKKQSFKIKRENLYRINREFKSKDRKTIQHMGYIEEYNRSGRIFKVRVKHISGKNVENINNKNKRQDAIDEQKRHINQDPEFQKSAKEYFFLDWNLYPIQITQYGAYCGNDTLLRMTGTEWEQVSSAQTIRLGQAFILEMNNDKPLFKLYKQDNNQNKQGQPIEESPLHSPGQIINRYPAYIAYHPQPNLVKVLTFQDDKTLGQLHTFYNEQLLSESDWQNVMTMANASSSSMLHAEPQECKVRPISTLVPLKPQLFVNQVMLTDGDVRRLTGYQHSFSNNQEDYTYSEKVTMIPGDKKDVYGWYETMRSSHVSSGNITKTENWFNANGQEVSIPPKEKTDEEGASNTTFSKSNKGLLLDRSGKWLISDFSPYTLADEMTAYYGFESYENNEIATSHNITKTWHRNGAKVIKGKFAFTGENFLQLSDSTTKNPSFFEGVLQPRDQETTYLAACWIRCSAPLTLHKPVPHFKALVSTKNGAEIIGLLAETKRQLGDWFYIELSIDFQIVKRIYQNYVEYNTEHHNTTTITPSAENAQLKITLRVEAPAGQTVDLDHIRFSPITQDFQATVYHPISGKSTALIQANGLVIRNIYNRLQQEISNTDEEGQLKQFLSSSKTGKLVPNPEGSLVTAQPNILSFEPESGFYETFDTHALRNRWFIDNPNSWHVAPGQLWHKHLGRHQVKPSTHLFDSTSAAVRCYFALQTSQSSLAFEWKGIGRLEFTRQSDNFTRLVLPKGHIIAPLPSAGELIIILEENHAWLWLDAVLLVDQELSSRIGDIEYTPWSSFALHVQGHVLVEDMLVMNRPQVKVEYYNAFGEKTQVIQLEDTKTSLVTETLYDEVGREAVTTKTTRVFHSTGQPVLAYHQAFVTNKRYSEPQSVWSTGKLQGEVDELNPTDGGVAYTRTGYAPNPLNEAAVLGLPGPDFAITGRYATMISQNSDIAFLHSLFPTSDGYRQKVEHIPNGSRKITIFDKNDNQVGIYVRVPSYNHLLSTYEYDAENRLIKILPPLYHEKVHTDKKSKKWQPGDDHLSTEEKQWQQALATYFVYDKYGHLIRKKTADSGVTEYLYNRAGQVRFEVYLNSSNQPQKIIFFSYGTDGQLSGTGYFTRLFSIATLQQYLESKYLPYIHKFQQFSYSDDHLNPSLRGRIKYCITYNQGEPIIDKLQYNAQQQIVTKNTVTLSGKADRDQLIELKNQYLNNKLHILTYPVSVDGKPLSIVHRYNKLGQLVALGSNDQQNHYASFGYHATGQLASEEYTRGFIRRYHYDSPGFLDQISDPFLTEEITYTEKGYGQTGYNGMITQTAFNASWPVNADGRWFQLRERDLDGNYSAICIEALKRTGYLTAYNKPVKLYTLKAETALPLVCSGRNIAKVVAEKRTPNYYGHRYAYGSHQELVKAKYFTDDSESFVEPLQSDSFAKKISKLTNHQSRHIWQLLVDAGYIITDQQRPDPATAIGTRGKSFFRNTELHKDLLDLNSNYTLYAQPIEQFIITLINRQRTISIADFETVFFHWGGLDQASSILIKNQQKAIAQQIGQMLVNKHYLPMKVTDFVRVLDKTFTSILHQYDTFIPQIVKVLSQHFAYELGEAAFDVQSYHIDANGNHRLFSTGFDRYELAYRNATNQIQSIKLDSPGVSEVHQTFAMLHDDQGNVIQALHKGIQSIKYHPVSQRTTQIRLVDGRVLRFYYDAQGERILKRVFNAKGKLSQETHYLRDEKGRVLVDRQTKFLPESTQEIVTAYLYGPRGLLGFFRNNNFYSVTTDHAGSVRLIIKEGKVVAAYDYLPYGQLMRSYGDDPQIHITYRYTGQEWDEETGLYNYHARLYDPTIGRFYQPDPKAQYFSPYKYAGNSPISTIDPDGELAFLLFCLAMAVLGAYLGGAAANNRWNPVDWDFRDSGTWVGIGGGALAGGLLPVGFAASAATIGIGGTVFLGAGGAYLATAAANQNWNPGQWQWDRPHTWSAVFQGFGSGSGIVGGVGLAHNFAKTGKALDAISKYLRISRDLTKVMFLGVSYTAGGGIAYAAGVRANDGNFAFWQWDLTNPATWSSLVDGFDTGMGWPQNFIEISRGIGKLGKNSQKSYGLFGKPSKMHKLKTILKNPKHPLYKTTGSVVMAYFMGSLANSEFDITRWSLASFSTYEGVLNGIFFGKDTSNMLKFARGSKIKQPPNALATTYKTKIKHWTEQFSRMLDNIQAFRTNIEYQYLMKQLFSSDKTWHAKLQQLRDAPDSLMRDAENFFKEGLGRWQKGDTEPPKALKHLISQEAEQKVYRSTETEKLIEWRAEEEGPLKKQDEVLSDRDVEFLNCRGISRRRKRGTDSVMHCLPSTSAADTSVTKPKVELIEQFFDGIDPGISRGTLEGDGFRYIQPRSKYNPNGSFDSDKPKGFAEHLSLILQKTPTDHGPSKPEFFHNFILGSLYTIPTDLSKAKNDVYAKVEIVDTFIPSGKNTHKTKVLKTLFKRNDETIVLKTFIFEEHKIKTNDKDEMKFYKDNLVSEGKYSKSELEAISTKLDVKDNYKIEENIFYVTHDHSLSIRESSTTKNDYEYKGTSSEEFHKIEPISIDPEHIDNLSSNDINEVKSGIAAISLELLHVYNSLKISKTSKRGNPGFEKTNQFGFDIKIEAAFHGFFYGALSLNFKYRYYLDIYVERITGKGYTDLILLSRKDNKHNKNWDVTPIVIEFKADATSASSATDQVTGTGYLYNLSMRTIADQAVIVGINSKIDLTDVSKAIDISTKNIPQPKGFVGELMRNIDSNTKDLADIKKDIKEELRHLYYSISPLAFKGDNNYFSRLILGEFLSAGRADVRVYEATDAVTTFVFQAKDSDKWIMLNIIANSRAETKGAKSKQGQSGDTHYIFDDVKNLGNVIKLPNNIPMSSLTRIDIKLNHLSKLGWSVEEKKRTDSSTKGKDNELLYFFQNMEVSDADLSTFSKTAGYTKLSSVDVDNFFIKGNIEGELDKLAKIIENIEVNSESDFQAIFHGIFLNKLDGNPHKIIKVLPEANLSKTGRIDLLIYRRVEMSPVSPMMEHVLIMELKFAKENVNIELDKANKQIFKYISNLKSIADSKVVTPITIVFNKNPQVGERVFIYELHHDEVISHTSGGSPRSQQFDDWEETPQFQQKLNKLADYVTTLTRIISDPQLNIKKFEKLKNQYVPELSTLVDTDIDGATVDKINANLQELNTDQNDSHSVGPNEKSEIDALKDKLTDIKIYIDGLKEFHPLEDVSSKRKHNEMDYVDSDYHEYSVEPKRSKSVDRSERSLNYAKDYENISNSNVGNRNASTEDKSYITIDKAKGINTENNHVDVASSGANRRFQFWPTYLVQNIGFLISSVLPIGWISDNTHYNKKSLSPNCLQLSQPDVPIKPIEREEAGSTLLEMGDQWYKESDMNGVLNLGILLVRKWTGYKPSYTEILSNDRERTVQLDIQSATIVDKFVKVLLEHARYCGIERCLSGILEDSALYCNTVQTVREKLNTGELEAVPQLLYRHLVQDNIRKVASESSQAQANKLLAIINEHIPNLQQELFEYEQMWLPYQKHEFKTMATQTCDNVQQVNAGNLSQAAISSTQTSEELAHSRSAKITSVNSTDIYRNVDISRN